MQSKRFSSNLAAILVLVSVSFSAAMASEVDPALDLNIGTVTLTPSAEQENTAIEIASDRLAHAGAGAVDLAAEVDLLAVLFDKIVNLGQKIWQLADQGKPVVTTRWTTANALPDGISDWKQMSGWQNPRAQTFNLNFTNLYGIDVVNFGFRIGYTAGGSYAGVGKYLSRVAVEPSNVLVRWGWNLDATAEVMNVVNVGTSKAPIAGMEILVRWKTKTVMNEVEGSASYFVRGDGAFLNLNQ